MSINRSLWTKPFSEKNFPNWVCPACGTGILRPMQDSFHTTWDSESELTSNTTEFDYESVKFRYIVILQCNNGKCKEGVVSLGNGMYESDSYYIEGGEEELTYIGIYFPRYFFPAVSIFQIPRKCPDRVAQEIKASFSLFFADPSAAANHIRKAVDAVLTDKGVRKIAVVNHKERHLPLHNRIEAFEKSQPETAKKLLAIKWIGNEGTHLNVTQDDVLDAYEILEVVMDDLYVGTRKTLEKKVMVINKKKRPLGYRIP